LLNNSRPCSKNVTQFVFSTNNFWIVVTNILDTS
jgi:hypothetical protein